MQRLTPIVFALALLACAAESEPLVPSILAIEDGQSVLYPSKVVTRRGSTSDQPIAVLQTEVLSGTTDRWSEYLELTPDGAAYRGEFIARLPADFASSATWSVVMAYRGSASVDQLWRVQLRDYDAGRWVTVGDNDAAASWVWSHLEFSVDDPTRYVSDTDQVRIRLESAGRDAMDLDYLAIRVGAPSPAPTDPSPAPTDPSPAPTDPSPAPTDPSPAPTDPSPAPTDPSPGPTDPSPAPTDPSPAPTDYLPTPNAGFDYQLGGAYSPPNGVTIVARDRTERPLPGLYNICYLNGFQTQPDEASFWNARSHLLLHDASGRVVIDPDWNEMILDVTTASKRSELAGIVGGWIDGCADAGFDAIEVDNLDTYSRSRGLIAQDDAVAFMALLAERAHARGIAIAQKNSAEILSRRSELHTDFAVAEECNRWSECGDFVDAYGDYVFVIEYRRSDFDRGCQGFPQLSIILRELDLGTPSSSGYVYDGC